MLTFGRYVMVAVAIIMHKAPAAFGLCTYLLNTGWDLGRTRRAMAIFSLASPLSALLVYLTISSLPMLNQPLSAGHVGFGWSGSEFGFRV